MASVSVVMVIMDLPAPFPAPPAPMVPTVTRHVDVNMVEYVVGSGSVVAPRDIWDPTVRPHAPRILGAMAVPSSVTATTMPSVTQQQASVSVG